jgi:Uma2 family endonuclease
VQPDEKDEKTGLIPDVAIICDREKYTKDEAIIIGAPDFVAEVLSPSTERYDRTIKFDKYWAAGVREYWLINIEKKEVWVYKLDKNAVITKYSFEDQIPLGISEGNIIIDFKSISDGLKRFFG